MLYLISLGIAGEKDITLRGLEAAKGCDSLYFEGYTSMTDTSSDKLGRLIGRPVMDITREGMEERSSKLVQDAKKKNVGILVGGDALSATTHLSLLLDCKKAGVEFRVVHGPSIFTAVAESGLSLYKFGETVTIPFWEENYRPAGFYHVIEKNRNAGLHTLILLDTGKGGMSVKQGLEILLDMDTEGMFVKDKLVAVARAGSENQKIVYAHATRLLEDDIGKPAVIILPGRMNVVEKEYLDSL